MLKYPLTYIEYVLLNIYVPIDILYLSSDFSTRILKLFDLQTKYSKVSNKRNGSHKKSWVKISKWKIGYLSSYNLK